MNVQKLVVWDKMPTQHPEADAQGSSASSSKTRSLKEEEPEIVSKSPETESTIDMTVTPIIDIPHSVTNVLNKIDAAQLERAKKDISKKLHDIQDNVSRVYARYKREDVFDPDLKKEYLRTATREEKSRRSNLLCEINDSLDQSAYKDKELEMVLESLKDWSDMMKSVELQEKVIPTQDWIEESENNLLKHFYAIKKNVDYLIKVCPQLLQEKKKMRQKSGVRAHIFKAWREKVAEQPHLAEPLSAEQMVEDEALTFSLAREVNGMILELSDLSSFNKGEVNAVKYIAGLVSNLAKAFGLVCRQCNSLKIKLEMGPPESRTPDRQVTSLQRELRMIIEKKAALEVQVQSAEERCKALLTTNEAMQRELRSTHERAQITRSSFSRPPVSKVPPEKATAPVDVEKDVKKASGKQLPKRQPIPSRGTSLEDEKSDSEDSGSEKLVSVLSRTQSQTPLAEDIKLKRAFEVPEKKTAPPAVPQESPEETAPLGKKTGLEFPIEKVAESTQKLKGDRDPTALLDSKVYKKAKLQKSQSATSRSVTGTYLSSSSRAGSLNSIQGKTSDGEPSPQSSEKSVHAPSIKAGVNLSSEKPLPELPREKAHRSSTQRDRRPTGQLPSLKRSVKKVIQAIRFQEHVKFQGGISAQVPLTAPDSREKLGEGLPERTALQKPQTKITEDGESECQDAGERQAQEQQSGRLQEMKEQKDPRSLLVERPMDISEEQASEQSERAKAIRDVIHDLGTQLQAMARDKGGMIEEETLKELFEQLDMTSGGQMYGSLPGDQLAQEPTVKKRELHVSPTDGSSTSIESMDKGSSGQEPKTSVQDFQASILACIEDKLEKLKYPSEALKQTKQAKPSSPQFQHLYQEIDRKLDECFSELKKKYRGAMMRRRVSSRGSEEEGKESKLPSARGAPPVSSRKSSHSSQSTLEEGEEQQMAPKDRRLSRQKVEPLGKVPAAFQDQQEEQGQRRGSSRHPGPKEEKAFLLPEEDLQVHEEKGEQKEPQVTEMPSLLASESGQGPWFLRLQERLEWEKERLQEEQSRLQEERLRLDDEEHYLEHWQHFFEGQQEEWHQRQQQQLDQELLWNAKLEHWQQLEKEHEEQQRDWELKEEEYQERLRQLQEELQQLQQQYKQQLLLQKEQTEEHRGWDQLRAQREQQLHAWQEEEKERDKQRSQWQQQLAEHQKQLEAWQQAKAEQELQFKKKEEQQRQPLQAQERPRQQRWEQQQQRRLPQVQERHQMQQCTQQTQLKGRAGSKRRESLWQTDYSELSIPVGPKTPMFLSPQTFGFPDVPRLLEVDTSSLRNKHLQKIRTRDDFLLHSRKKLNLSPQQPDSEVVSLSGSFEGSIMNVQKLVVWDKVPTQHPEADAQGSSSSSSKTRSLKEEEPEIVSKSPETESTIDMTVAPIIDIPHSVTNVLNKIDAAQLERAKKDISKKLHDIQDNVSRVYARYKREDAFDPDLKKEYLRTATREEKSRRSNLLCEINDSLDQSAYKDKELEMVLESLKDWSDMMKSVELQEKIIPTQDWIEESENNLLKHFYAIKKNVDYLIKVCPQLLQEKKKMRQKSGVRAHIFKTWREKVAEQPHLAEPLSAEQMVEDEALTFSLAREVNGMILELSDLSSFNKGEVNAVKYIAGLVSNLAKAFGLVCRQCNSLKIKLEMGPPESRTPDRQVTSLQRELRMIIEKKAALEVQVQSAEERCKALLTTNEAMQRELRSTHERAQITRSSFSRPPVSKVPPEKATAPVDVEKDVKKASGKQLPKRQPIPSRGTSLEDEKSDSEDSGSEKLVSVLSRTQSQTPLAEDIQLKRAFEVPEKKTAPPAVPQESPEETAPLGKKTGLEFPIEKVAESTQKLKGDRDPTALLDSKVYKKAKLQKSQSATSRSVTGTYLSSSSRAGSLNSIQGKTSDGEPSPQSSEKSVHAPSIKAGVNLSSEKPLTELPREKAHRSSTQRDRRPTGQLPSLKRSVKKVIQAIRFQEHVKFQGGISAQVPLTAPDSREKLGEGLPERTALQKPQTKITEDGQSECQDAGERQAQEQQSGRLQEMKEQKDPRSLLVERPMDISEEQASEQSERAKAIRDVIHDLGTQLQAMARDKGGMIEEETLKELFEQLDMTSGGQMYGSLPGDQLAQEPTVKKRELHVSPTDGSSTSIESMDKGSSGQEPKTSVQDFQASILACIEDKLEKLKYPSEALKQTKQAKPSSPQFQHLYQEIDRKLDECFSELKKKYRGAMMRRRVSSRGSEEEGKESKLPSARGAPPVSSRKSSHSSQSTLEEGEEQQMAPKDRRLSRQKVEPLGKVPAAFQDQQEEQGQRRGSSRHPGPKEEKAFLLPEEDLQVHEEKGEQKEPQVTEMPSLLASESGQGPWFLRLQERLEWEKERLQEEQSRLQEERLRLDDEEHYLEHWQHFFEGQQEEWHQRQQQQLDQELLWNAKLEHWQQLEKEHEEQQRDWELKEEEYQERLRQLQEELQQLQQQYKQQLLLQKEQTEEHRGWDQLRAQREQQLHAWQEEEKERDKQRSQWQQQLAEHQKQLEAWQQAKAEQELQFKKKEEQQRQPLQAQERPRQQRWEQQQQRRLPQVQERHQMQQCTQQTQLKGRAGSKRRESLWQTDYSELSIPVGPKTPMFLSPQTFGFPDVPRLLEVDTSSLRNKHLQKIRTRDDFLLHSRKKLNLSPQQPDSEVVSLSGSFEGSIMNVQKLVVWDKVPTQHPEADAQGSSASSSKTRSLKEEEPEIVSKSPETESTIDMTVAPIIDIPHSVTNVLNKIDAAQLERAKKDISKKLHDIQDNVSRVYARYKREDVFDPDLKKEYLRTATREEKSRRSNLLCEINDSLDQSAYKDKELEMVLESLKDWSDMMKSVELQEKVIPTQDWIEESENNLLKHFYAIKKNVDYLIKVCPQLLQEKKKMRQKSGVRAHIFKAWREKVAEQPHLAEPLSAEQMVEDEALTFSLAREVNGMILELSDLSSFNKGEVNAVKYIAGLVSNLAKAFGLVCRQCNSLKIKLEMGPPESRTPDRQVTSLQRELRMIIEKKAALEVQVQSAEERCKALLTTNEAMQRELRSTHERAQITRSSFSRPPVSKVPPEKATAPVDVEKDVKKASGKQLPKRQPIPSRGTSLEDEKSDSEDSGSEKLVSVLSRTQSQTPLAEDIQLKRAFEVPEKKTAPPAVPQESPEETAPLGKKTGLEFPIEKVAESTQKLKGDRDPTALLDSKVYKKAKLQKSQSATSRSVTGTYLSSSSRAGSLNSIQGKTSDGEPSPQSSEKSVHAASIKAGVNLSSEKPLPELPREKAHRSSTQRDRRPTGQLPSLKRSVKKVIQAIRFQEHVKFQGGISAQVPLTAPDSREKLGEGLPERTALQKPQTKITEDGESECQDAGERQAQEQQSGRLQEMKEQKDPRSLLVERPMDISEEQASEQSERAKAIRDVIHDLGTQLQAMARDKGGMIEEETLKELFEQLDMTSGGQMYGSLPGDQLAQEPTVKKRELHVSPTDGSSTSIESMDKGSSGQEPKTSVQDFQASILACIEDKLEKLKYPSEALKQTKQAKPSSPQFQHLYQEIDRKLDECFSELKKKYRGAMMRRRVSSRGSEEEGKESKLPSARGAPPVSSRKSSHSSQSTLEEGEEQQMAPKDRRLSRQKVEPLGKVPAAFQDQQEEQGQRRGSSRHPGPKEEKAFLLPEEDLQVHEEKGEQKEPQVTEMPSLLASESGQGPWFLRLQERLEWEKERLQEEQSRLQEERLRLDDEEHYLEHWQHFFEGQQEEWHQRQQQQLDQELLWNAKLEHWQQLEKEHEEQQRDWELKEEEYQERLRQLQEELQQLQQQYKQQLLLQKEQTEEHRGWDQLRAQREQQLHAWQEEEKERDKQRSQWQQQLAEHQKQLEAWQQAKAEQELQFKKKEEQQRQPLQAQERPRQQRWEQQQQRRLPQVQERHQMQQCTQQTQLKGRAGSKRRESLWQTDYSELSIPVGPKTPMFLSPQTFGFPDVPRLLEVDTSSLRNKHLQKIRTRVQSVPRWKVPECKSMR